MSVNLYSSFDSHNDKIKSDSIGSNDTISLFIERAKNRKLNQKQNNFEFLTTTLESSKSNKNIIDRSDITNMQNIEKIEKIKNQVNTDEFSNEKGKKSVQNFQNRICSKVFPKFISKISKNVQSTLSKKRKNALKENTKTYPIQTSKSFKLIRKNPKNNFLETDFNTYYSNTNNSKNYNNLKNFKSSNNSNSSNSSNISNIFNSYNSSNSSKNKIYYNGQNVNLNVNLNKSKNTNSIKTPNILQSKVNKEIENDLRKREIEKSKDDLKMTCLKINLMTIEEFHHSIKKCKPKQTIVNIAIVFAKILNLSEQFPNKNLKKWSQIQNYFVFPEKILTKCNAILRKIETDHFDFLKLKKYTDNYLCGSEMIPSEIEKVNFSASIILNFILSIMTYYKEMKENWFRKSPSPFSFSNSIHSQKGKIKDPKNAHYIDANKTCDFSTLSTFTKSNTLLNLNYQSTNKPSESFDFSPNIHSYYQTMTNSAKPTFSDLQFSKNSLLKTLDFGKEITSLKDQYKKFEEDTNLIINSFKA